jgi:hypothetical protein
MIEQHLKPELLRDCGVRAQAASTRARRGSVETITAATPLCPSINFAVKTALSAIAPSMELMGKIRCALRGSVNRSRTVGPSRSPNGFHDA